MIKYTCDEDKNVISQKPVLVRMKVCWEQWRGKLAYHTYHEPPDQKQVIYSENNTYIYVTSGNHTSKRTLHVLITS